LLSLCVRGEGRTVPQLGRQDMARHAASGGAFAIDCFEESVFSWMEWVGCRLVLGAWMLKRRNLLFRCDSHLPNAPVRYVVPWVNVVQLWDFHRVGHLLQPCDIMLVLGR